MKEIDGDVYKNKIIMMIDCIEDNGNLAKDQPKCSNVAHCVLGGGWGFGFSPLDEA